MGAHRDWEKVFPQWFPTLSFTKRYLEEVLEKVDPPLEEVSQPAPKTLEYSTPERAIVPPDSSPLPDPSVLPSPIGLVSTTLVSPASALSTSFMINATVRPFRPACIPPMTRPPSFNDDLTLGSFRPSKLVWSGEQRRGVSMLISDASSISDHVMKSLDLEFFLAKDIPLPVETLTAMEFTLATPFPLQVDFWQDQLQRVKLVVEQASDLQNEWYSKVDQRIHTATGKVNFIAMMSLMDQFGMGGKNWLQQFVWGFPIVGDLSQSGVFPTDPNAVPAPDPSGLWAETTDRFKTRAKNSGWCNADHLWEEALEQTEKGWLSAPLPIDPEGRCPDAALGPINISFRFAVDQMDKLRACDDLKYGTTNLYCSVWTPIKLPTWDHIAQLAALARPSTCAWSFFKTDHESAYKQLPIAPEDQRTSVVALRGPKTGKWMAFVPRTLLFGAVAAVLHYNCFSRAVAVLFTKVTGIPLLSYFDDFGALVPSDILDPALEAFMTFCQLLGLKLKDSKTEKGPALTFLGIFGDFPGPHNDMSLTVSLPREKALRWGAKIQEFIALRTIQHKELESLIGRLSFTQTSVFGRVGRAMMAALYQKVNAKFYSPDLSDRELTTLNWWSVALLNLTPRLTRNRSPVTDLIIYTDAATTTQIIAAVLIDPRSFRTTRTTSAVVSARVGPHWRALFSETCEIYGLEMLAILAILFDPLSDLRGLNIMFFVDNNNALEALVSNAPGPRVIAAMTQLIWYRIAQLNAAVWFERVPSTKNIADLPTKMKPMPYPSDHIANFKCLRRVYDLIVTALADMDAGHPVKPPVYPYPDK